MRPIAKKPRDKAYLPAWGIAHSCRYESLFTVQRHERALSGERALTLLILFPGPEPQGTTAPSRFGNHPWLPLNCYDIRGGATHEAVRLVFVRATLSTY
jgi:hypothetical protein